MHLSPVCEQIYLKNVSALQIHKSTMLCLILYVRISQSRRIIVFIFKDYLF